MKKFSFYNEGKKKTIPKNLELWDLSENLNETNKEMVFHSQCSNVIIRVKNIDRDLVPDGFQEKLEA